MLPVNISNQCKLSMHYLIHLWCTSVRHPFTPPSHTFTSHTHTVWYPAVSFHIHSNTHSSTHYNTHSHTPSLSRSFSHSHTPRYSSLRRRWNVFIQAGDDIQTPRVGLVAAKVGNYCININNKININNNNNNINNNMNNNINTLSFLNKCTHYVDTPYQLTLSTHPVNAVTNTPL